MMGAGKLGSMEPALHGLYVPLITPFTEDGDLAPGALEELAHSVIDAGAAGLVALGTTGEPAALTAPEQRTVLGICARACRERNVTLIAGAGSNDTAGTLQALRDLASWPEVSAALTVVPYYTRPSQDGVIAHFTRLAADSPVPLIVYNIPYRTGTSLSLRTLRELVSIPGIIAIKHAVTGIDHDTVALLAGLPSDFAVLAGEDALASALLALGAAGGILASAHLCTGDFAGLIAAWRSGKPAEAREIGRRLIPLSLALFAEPNPVVIKGVLHAQGKIPSPAVRLPHLPARHDTVHATMSLLAAMDAAADRMGTACAPA
jgi:4-hydroxy-tetrahydrodipicolinate synthase